MILLRSLLYQAVLIGSSLAYSIAVLIVGWGASDQRVERLARSWGRLNLRALKSICRLEYRIKGAELLPNEPAVILSKHQSAWEIVALRAMLPLQQSWVLKQELTRIPFFGWALLRFKPIAIDRAAGRRAVIQLVREGIARLDEGCWIIVFPEGTRVAPGAQHSYGIGGALLAERSGRPVVPIAHNAGVFWGRRSLIKRPGTIDLVIGPVLQTRGRKAVEINAMTQEWIEGAVAELPSR